MNNMTRSICVINETEKEIMHPWVITEQSSGNKSVEYLGELLSWAFYTFDEFVLERQHDGYILSKIVMHSRDAPNLVDYST